MRPEARTIAAKTSPTACRAVTPSARRAPPECQMPVTGTRSRRAVSMASTMCRQPSTPIAPPMTVASVQNAIAGLPFTVPRPASTPEVSRAASCCMEPGSKNRRRRSSGSRGSGATGIGAAWTAVTGSPRRPRGGGHSGGGEDQRGVVAAEAEGVVDGGGEGGAPRLVAHDVERLDGGVVVRVLEVGGRGHDLLAEREDREDGLQRAGRAQQMAGRALGGAPQDVGTEGRADRRSLGGVPDRGGGGVGVDVPDIGRAEP